MLDENCYIVSDETKECMIIDCGASCEMEQRAISDYIKAEGLKPVIYVLTHGHFDHTMGGKWLYDTYGLQPTICERDAELYKNFREDIASMIGYQVDYDLPFIGRCLNDGDNITFGNSTFKVINTPGHSKGSVVFYNKENKVAFTGDTLFRGSIGRTDLPGGDMATLIRSLKRLIMLPDNTQVYPGHGYPTTIEHEKQYNPYL